MRLHRTLLIVGALLALAVLLTPLAPPAGGVAAAQAAGPGLDRSFGTHGTTTVTKGSDEDRLEAFRVTAGGRSYILDDNQILAFQSNGKIAGHFGERGRLTLAPDFARGEVGARDLALDSRGRILVTGSALAPPGWKADKTWVIRMLPNGSRDPEFGTDGEVDTTFGLPAVNGTGPSVSALTIAVDAADRPVVGGAFGKEPGYCDFGRGPDPFLARLSATGALDTTFAGSGHAVLTGPGELASLIPAPGGGLAVFSRRCPSEPRLEATGSQITAFTESGEASATTREVLLPFSYQAPLLDPAGRIVQLESVSPAAEGVDAVARSLPDGERDPSFGLGGRAPLHQKPHYGTAIAVDAQSRPIIALGAGKIVLRRYLPEGNVDTTFGPGGRLTAAGSAPSAIALDASGRIYTVSLAPDLHRTKITLARFIPGP